MALTAPVAFMYQPFARRFGTNNYPDCSNMCHEPTSVGLPENIGIGKGTVLLDDFAHAEAIFIIGQKPGTSSPRVLTELHRASRRAVPIVVFNPSRERALERFATPQDPVEMVTFGETRRGLVVRQRQGTAPHRLETRGREVTALPSDAPSESLRSTAFTVIDMSRVLAGPYCTMILTDLVCPVRC